MSNVVSLSELPEKVSTFSQDKNGQALPGWNSIPFGVGMATKPHPETPVERHPRILATLAGKNDDCCVARSDPKWRVYIPK